MNIAYVQIHFTEVSAHYLTTHNIAAYLFNAIASSFSNCMPLHDHAQVFLPLKDIANTFVVLDSFLNAHNTTKQKTTGENLPNFILEIIPTSSTETVLMKSLETNSLAHIPSFNTAESVANIRWLYLVLWYSSKARLSLTDAFHPVDFTQADKMSINSDFTQWTIWLVNAKDKCFSIEYMFPLNALYHFFFNSHQRRRKKYVAQSWETIVCAVLCYDWTVEVFVEEYSLNSRWILPEH